MKSVEELAREEARRPKAHRQFTDNDMDWVELEDVWMYVEDGVKFGHASRDEEINDLVVCLRDFIHEANEAYSEGEIYRLVPMIDEARDLLSKFEPKKEGV